MTVRIGMAGADPDGQRRFAAEVSDPGSKEYRHFLTPAEVKMRFGPTASQVKKVHEWVAAAGLEITAENGHWVDVAGTPQQVARAFAPDVVRLREPGDPVAAAAAATVPVGLAGVSSVAGLGPQRHGVRMFSHRVGPTRGLRGLGSDPAPAPPPTDSPGACSPSRGATAAAGFPKGYHDPEDWRSAPTYRASCAPRTASALRLHRQGLGDRDRRRLRFADHARRRRPVRDVGRGPAVR